MSADKELTFMGHLRELRTVIFRTAIAFIVALPISFYVIYYFNVFDILKKPATDRFPDLPLIYTEPTEMVSTYIKVTLLLALMICLPYILYNLVSFVRPALTRTERRYVYVMLPAVVICFTIGAAFAYFVLLPPAFGFLFTFGSNVAQPMIKVGKYISLLTTLLFWIGLCFEIPIILYFLTRIGVIRPEWLVKYRKVLYIAAFVLGAIITPTVDPVNQALVAIPVIALFEIGIILSKIARRKKTAVTSSV
jgi:sec-independent protein translocase protein TatC